MKKIYSFMVAAVAMFAAISCTQELDTVKVTDTSFFTAFTDGVDTKTVKDGSKSLWADGDQIWVLNGQKGGDNDYSWKKSYTTHSNAASEAVFEEDKDYDMTGSAFFAVYPASAATNATWEGQGKEVKHIELKKVQTATVGSFDPEAHITVAQTTDNTLSFKNAVSLLKFKVASEGVKSITIYSNNKEKRELLTGLCSIAANGDVTPWTNYVSEGVPEAENWVELSAGQGEFTKDKDYYLSVFPVTLAKGFTVEFSYDGTQKQTIKSYDKELVLPRNGVLDLGLIEHDAHPFSVAGTFNNWNTLANPMAYENGLYVVRGVTALSSSSTGFKFVLNGETWRGAEGKVNANAWNYVWGEGSNVYVNGSASDTAYDIYLTLAEGDYGMFVIVPAGETMPKMPRDLNFDKKLVSVTLGSNVSEPALSGKTKDVVYQSSDISIAEVDAEGNVTTHSAGTVTITATAPETDIYQLGETSYTLEVKKKNRDLKFSSTSESSINGSVFTKPNLSGTTSGVTYSSSNENLATVDASGDVTVKNSNGTVVITASAPETEEYLAGTATYTISVNMLYLIPNSNWKVDGARFAAYFFGNGETWVSMTDTDKDGVYEVKVPTNKKYPKVIFCRMTPNATANNWNNKWNQTGDLTVPTNGNNLFTITQWDNQTSGWSKMTN